MTVYCRSGEILNETCVYKTQVSFKTLKHRDFNFFPFSHVLTFSFLDDLTLQNKIEFVFPKYKIH